MSLTTLNILTQRFENYSDNPEVPYWKEKGPFEFTMKIEADFWMYDRENMEMLVNQIVENDMSNEHEKFEVRECELSFLETCNIQKEFDKKFKDLMDQREYESAQCDIDTEYHKLQI